MARWGNADYRQLQKLRDNLKKLQDVDMDSFCRDVSKELAARLLRLVIKRTPIGNYDGTTYVCAPSPVGQSHSGHTVKGKKGGTLRRGWTARTHDEAESGGNIKPDEYAAALPISKSGHTYTVTIINPVMYASYVEYGHVKVNGGWVEGHYFLTLSEQELEKMAPSVIEKKLEKLLKDTFKV